MGTHSNRLVQNAGLFGGLGSVVPVPSSNYAGEPREGDAKLKRGEASPRCLILVLREPHYEQVASPLMGNVGR